jgi:hypothetical protein
MCGADVVCGVCGVWCGAECVWCGSGDVVDVVGVVDLHRMCPLHCILWENGFLLDCALFSFFFFGFSWIWMQKCWTSVRQIHFKT